MVFELLQLAQCCRECARESSLGLGLLDLDRASIPFKSYCDKPCLHMSNVDYMATRRTKNWRTTMHEQKVVCVAQNNSCSDLYD